MKIQNKHKRENSYWRALVIFLLLLILFAKDKLTDALGLTENKDCCCEDEPLIPVEDNGFVQEKSLDVEKFERETDSNLRQMNTHELQQIYFPKRDDLMLKKFVF